MKRYFLPFLISVCSVAAFAQDKQLSKDLDGDGKPDKVYFSKNDNIVCELSTQASKKMQSKPVEELQEHGSLAATKSGFELRVWFMRAGYALQFRFDKDMNKMRLIGISREEFGNAVHDGAGASSVNLLTNSYIGNWSYYDEQRDSLMGIPTIETKMVFPKIYLEDVSEDTYFDFADKCSALYEQHKAKTIKATK